MLSEQCRKRVGAMSRVRPRGRGTYLGEARDMRLEGAGVVSEQCRMRVGAFSKIKPRGRSTYLGELRDMRWLGGEGLCAE